MYIHAIHSQFLAQNVRVEVVYEDNPVFADEEVSAIIRFRHLGEPVVAEPAVTRPVVNDGADSGWFGKRLSMQLSNATRSLFLEENGEKDNKVNEPVELLTGFVQLSGFITYDPQVVNHEKVEGFRKSSAVSGKIGGLDGLEVTRTQNNGLLGQFSGMFNQNIDDIAQQRQTNSNELDTMIPFFATPKSLLFGEVRLQPGETQVFYFKCRLPRALPPSYEGKSISIHYRLITGASLNHHGTAPTNLHFPLNLAQHFNEQGYQPTASLDKFTLLSSDKLFNVIFQSETGRRSSFKSIRNLVLTEPKLSQTSKKDKFRERLEQMLSEDQAQLDFKVGDFKNASVKENIANYTELVINRGKVDDGESTIRSDGYTLEKQVVKLQTQYLINYNGRSIATLTFSKPIYKLGESMRITLDFHSKDMATTGVLVSVESLELIRDSFATDQTQPPLMITHFKESYATMNQQLTPLNIPIPLSATAQFKTSIFESKWSLALKFVLSDAELQHTVHEDATGSMQFSPEAIAGSEFNCRMPLCILPPDQDLGGITT